MGDEPPKCLALRRSLGTSDSNNPTRPGCDVCPARQHPAVARATGHPTGRSDRYSKRPPHNVHTVQRGRPPTVIPCHAADDEDAAPRSPTWELLARRRWRRIQYLADQFWARWRREYLQSLQRRRKWNTTSRDLTIGYVVLRKEEGAHRNSWPTGRVSDTIRSEDGHVRTVEVTLVQDGKRKTFLRPVKELVLLLPTGPELTEQ